MIFATGGIGGPNTAWVTVSSNGTPSRTTTTPITCLARPREVTGPFGTAESFRDAPWSEISGDPWGAP
jgi:hypothetical protein